MTTDFAEALITPAGQTHTKATYLGDVASKRLEYLDFEPSSSISVRASRDFIVLRYIARIRLVSELPMWST